MEIQRNFSVLQDTGGKKYTLVYSILLLHASLVPRHQIFCARPAALLKNRVWTRSQVKLGRNYTSVVGCCRTNQIVQVK